jgi:hypothetical protein
MEGASNSENPFKDLNSIITYIKENIIQILLLVLVFIIIYVVDHISNINSILFGIPSAVIGVSAQNTQVKPNKPAPITKKSKMNNKK